MVRAPAQRQPCRRKRERETFRFALRRDAHAFRWGAPRRPRPAGGTQGERARSAGRAAPHALLPAQAPARGGGGGGEGRARLRRQASARTGERRRSGRRRARGGPREVRRPPRRRGCLGFGRRARERRRRGGCARARARAAVAWSARSNSERPRALPAAGDDDHGLPLPKTNVDTSQGIEKSNNLASDPSRPRGACAPASQRARC